MPADDTDDLNIEWSFLECDVQEFVHRLQQAGTQWLYNGAQLDQVVAIDVKATIFLDEIHDLLVEIGAIESAQDVILTLST